jgi:ATP-binding cassette subfamily B protein/subfamily B ATP-binding cassette protein MsbA
MFVVMARIDLPLTLLALLVIPLQGVAFAVFARPMSRQSEAQWRTQGEVMAFMENVLGAIKAIQGFAREPYFARRARQAAEALGATYERSAVTGTAYQQTVAALTGVATAIMLGVGAVHVRNGDVTVGDLFVFITYLGALYGPVREVAQAVGIGVQVSARARRVFAILDSDEVIPDDRPGTSVRLPIGEISFEGVSTGYDRGAGPLLQDVSFRVPAGHVVAIVGMSGAGKTTLISLLSRFADQWTGRICFDGIDIREYSLVSVREQVALVLQDPFLLPMSIADNIAFGDPWATRPAIEAAARTAQVHEFVTRLPRGYDTVIGERGVTLSGGERQRLSIARAVLADAPILVLDEPTSALDARTEELIFGALDEAIAGRTVFIISHRLSTIRRADLIIAIDGGRVAEIGTHEALLAQDGVYADLYRKQYLELR